MRDSYILSECVFEALRGLSEQRNRSAVRIESSKAFV